MARGTRYRSGHELLADITPEEWQYMRASYKLDPHGDDWERSSMIAAEVRNAIVEALYVFAGSNDEPPILPRDAFVPYRKHVDPEEQQIEASLKALEESRGI